MMTLAAPARTIQALLMALLAAMACVCGGCQDTISDRDIRTLPLTEVRRLSEKDPASTLLLDVRRPSQYAQERIPGAVNVPANGIQPDKEKLAPEFRSPKYVIVYGENPGDGYAAAVTKTLLRAGQKGARLFAGGLAEWKKAGLATEKSR